MAIMDQAKKPTESALSETQLGFLSTGCIRQGAVNLQQI
jgi:hypothetical protein